MSAKLALITGARRGIGLALAEAALRRDYTVIGTATTHDRANEMQAKFAAFAGQFKCLPLDVRSAQQISAVCAELERSWHRLDLLVNNAGAGRGIGATLAAQSDEDWRTVIETNLAGPFRLCREALPLLASTPDSIIVNISGALGRFSTGMNGGGGIAYRVSKAGLNALTLALAEEIGPTCPRVVAIDPEWVRTDLGGPDAPRSAEEVAEEIMALVASPRATSGHIFRRGEPCAW
jgi:NAD(P)-dependent dehydrogenase (short-subunit alcohol dehydrogenase family)